MLSAPDSGSSIGQGNCVLLYYVPGKNCSRRSETVQYCMFFILAHGKAIKKPRIILAYFQKHS